MDHQASAPPAETGNFSPASSSQHDLRAAGTDYAGIERFVLVSDLDGTLIDDQMSHSASDPALRRFAEVLREAGQRLTLWFNSSRPVASQRDSLKAVPHLPVPQFQIGAMGTQVADGETGDIVGAYAQEQFGDWPRDEIHAVASDLFGLTRHPEELQTPFKASYDLPYPEMAVAIEGELQARGLPVKVVVSSGKDLDLLPPTAGKASAIRWLCARTNTPQEAVVVSGDSANDLDMFSQPFRGIVVANGHPELKRLDGDAVYHASSRCAAGVLEGLRHFDVVRSAW